MNSAATTVTFSNQAGPLSVEIDDAASTGNSPYRETDQVVVRLYGANGAEVTTDSIGCQLQAEGKDQRFSHTEVLTIVNGNQLSLHYPAVAMPAVTWLAKKGKPLALSWQDIEPSLITLSQQIALGVAEVTYDVAYDRYRLKGFNGKAALVVFTAADGRTANLELGLESTAAPVDVSITITDYVTNAVVPGAAVSISGPHGYAWNGTADDKGVVALSGLVRGSYTVTSTAAGYQSSASDILRNDSFTL